MEGNLAKSAPQRTLQEGVRRPRERAVRCTRRALLVQVLLLALGVLSGCYSPYYAKGDSYSPYPYSYGYSRYGYPHHGFGYYGNGGRYGHHRYYRH